MYNPINDRINNLMNQKQMIESQLQNIQQLANIPPININNQITPNVGLNDFNGKWVNNEQEARNMMVNGLPSIMLDRNDSVFYMKSLDGSFKKYRFQEETEPKKDNIEQRLDKLEAIYIELNKLNNEEFQKRTKKRLERSLKRESFNEYDEPSTNVVGYVTTTKSTSI